MKSFQDKVVLVTGGRTGIGAACANAFSNNGATVVTAQRGNDNNFECINADLLDPDAPQQVIEAVIAKHSRLDVLVNLSLIHI